MTFPFVGKFLLRGLGACLLVTPVGFTCEAPSGPGPRLGHSVAFDENRARVVLFGGFAPEGVPLGDTWEWDGRRWHRIHASGPSPRKWAAMAYDSKRRRTVLFGGLEGFARTGDSLGDTWAWDGKTWEQLATDGPPARDHHAMVYDRDRDRLVLFGGWDAQAGSALNDTWAWDGKKWVQVAAAGPPARAAHAMAYHRGRGVTVLFGGRTPKTYFNDTWTWDGQQWAQAEVQGPADRAFHAMAYLSQSERTLLFGGRIGSELFGDTWLWSGSNWLNAGVPGPSGRYSYSMAYDRSRQQAVLFGGGHKNQESDEWILHQDTWLWEGGSWQRVGSSGCPPPA